MFKSQLPPGLSMPPVLSLPPPQRDNRAAVPASEAGVSLPLHDQEGTLLLMVPPPLRGEHSKEFFQDSRAS